VQPVTSRLQRSRLSLPHPAILVVFCLAVAVRLWGIQFGLPYDLTADEPHQIVQALKIGAGEGGPLVRMWHTIGKGGLDYILFFEYGVLFVVWWLIGRVHESREFALEYLNNPTAFYLVGRVTVAMMGALTSVAVGEIGRRLYDARVGAAAALFGAVAYYHAAYSHVINVHIPMAFALWTGVWAYLQFERTRRRRALIASGLLCGAAVALAYTAGIGLMMLLTALILAPGSNESWRARLEHAGILVTSALVTIGLMSPDLLTGAGLLVRNFVAPTGAGPQGSDLRAAIDSVTILRQAPWTGYLELLAKPYNVLTAVGAAAGIAAGVWRRERWTLLLSGTTLLFVTVVSAANRGASESYLLPVTPALWLLCSRGVAWLSSNRRLVFTGAAAVLAAVPLFFTVRDDVMLARPDTRVLAKEWIEANVPTQSKILMDGMRFRFVQSAPLNGNKATVERRLADLEESELALSDEMLSLYREAAGRIEGPTYNLYSTMYGLEVEELDYYVAACFDYIVVSSFNEKRYATDPERSLHPKSARFYDDIKTDDRFRRVYAIEPIVWKQIGPAITVYRVLCDGDGQLPDHLR
jgi:4-amino-4-deoxy-L-arabinose transferase-like glycosyltransferase